MMGLVGKIGGALFVVGLLLYLNFSAMSSSVPPPNTRSQHEMATHMRVVAEKLVPELSLTYSGFSLGASGEIYLSHAQIRPAIGPDLITAERVVIRNADVNYMRELWQELAMSPISERWPNRVSIRLEGARVELTEQNILQLDRLFARRLKGADKAVVAMFSCRDHDRFSFQTLKAMGVDALTGSFDVNYSLNTVAKRLHGQLMMDLDQLLVLDTRVEFATEPTPEVDEALETVGVEPRYDSSRTQRSRKALRYLNGEKLARHPLELTSFTLNYADKGFHERRNNHCAATLEEPVAQYIETTGETFTGHLIGKKWRLAPESVRNFGAFLQPQAKFEMDVSALKPYIVSGRKARSLKPSAEMLNYLDVQLVLNNNYENLREMWADIELSPQDRVLDLSAEEARKAAVRAAILKAVGKSPETYQPAFRTVAVADVDGFIGKQIKLKTYFGRRVEGRLSRIENNVLYVKEYLEQGSAIYPIDRSKVSEVEIYH